MLREVYVSDPARVVTIAIDSPLPTPAVRLCSALQVLLGRLDLRDVALGVGEGEVVRVVRPTVIPRRRPAGRGCAARWACTPWNWPPWSATVLMPASTQRRKPASESRQSESTIGPQDVYMIGYGSAQESGGSGFAGGGGGGGGTSGTAIITCSRTRYAHLGMILMMSGRGGGRFLRRQIVHFRNSQEYGWDLRGRVRWSLARLPAKLARSSRAASQAFGSDGHRVSAIGISP